MNELLILLPFTLYTGWGVFGYTMWRLDSFYFQNFPSPMIFLMMVIGAILSLGVLSITKAIGIS